MQFPIILLLCIYSRTSFV